MDRVTISHWLHVLRRMDSRYKYELTEDAKGLAIIKTTNDGFACEIVDTEVGCIQLVRDIVNA